MVGEAGAVGAMGGGRASAVAASGALLGAGPSAGAEDAGEGWATSERVSTRRQIALLGCAGALFTVSAVALLALGWMVLPSFSPAAPPTTVAAPDRAAANGAVPPRALSEAANAPSGADARPSTAPSPAPSPSMPAATPAPRPTERPEPAKAGSTFTEDAPEPPPRAPAPPPAAAPAPKPAPAGAGRLTFSFAEGFLGAQLSLKCPSGTRSFDLRPPASTVPAIPDDCSVYVRCNGGSPVAASRLPHSGTATCGGCTRTDTRPACR
jgi:hypothetical protein